ncbi:hypothetical protein IGI04_035912 [Brassica rapa subsp. trilocularis]|uniref:Uncharacterized protein n=1 Tax=Brassica rapa subsp. trilocularis TaxID=1813537 RepID=A0ABQ7LCX6_BRACM|nr:hypothetical protein IGI04_035912 [Brassica rapa subsp. trilocularis]
MTSSIKEESLKLRYCAQPDHNPPPEPMKETETKTIGLGICKSMDFFQRAWSLARLAGLCFKIKRYRTVQDEGYSGKLNDVIRESESEISRWP